MIRDATSDDIPRLVAMGTRFLTETVYAGRIRINPAAMAKTFQLLIASDVGALFVSERAGVVIGMIGLLVFEHPFTGELAAHELFWWVEPESRGHGLRLLRHAERWAQDAGAQHVHMVAPTREVEQVYQRLGYGYLEAAYQKALGPPVHDSEGRLMVVIDDVLDDPMAYRRAVLARPFGEVSLGPDLTFHGIQLADDSAFPRWIRAQFPHLTPTLSFFRQSPLGQHEPNYVHTDRDMGDWTALLYLNPHPLAGDGTTFWRHRASGAIGSEAGDEDAWLEEQRAWRDLSQWESIGSIAAKFGRAVVFPSDRFHSRAIPENYGTGDDARLVQVVFGIGAL